MNCNSSTRGRLAYLLLIIPNPINDIGATMITIQFLKINQRYTGNSIENIHINIPINHARISCFF